MARLSRLTVIIALVLPALASQPAAAANGDPMIVYTNMRYAPPALAIRLVDTVTGSARRLAYGSSPAWSPNGKQLAFIGLDNIIRFRAPNGTITDTGVSAFGANYYSAADMNWSPNGNWLAYGDAGSVWVMSVTPPYQPVEVSSDGYSPTWSPDSSQIAYSADGDLHIVNRDGSDDHVVPISNLYIERPDWSPDGSKFAFLGYSSSSPQPEGLFVASTDGTDLTFLQSTYKFCCGAPDWSPDGSRIAFIGDQGLAVIDADGSNEQVIVGGRHASGHTLQPEWRP